MKNPKNKKAKDVSAYTPPQRDQHADGLRIRDMIDRDLPEHRAAIDKLYEECPHKVGFNSANGKYEGPVTSSNVAAWAMKSDSLVERMRRAGVI